MARSGTDHMHPCRKEATQQNSGLNSIKPYNGTLLDIDVATNSGNKVLTALTVHSSNFEKINEWQSFEVKFTLQNDVNIVEFRGVNVRETAPISLRSVEVYADNGQAHS